MLLLLSVFFLKYKHTHITRPQKGKSFQKKEGKRKKKKPPQKEMAAVVEVTVRIFIAGGGCPREQMFWFLGKEVCKRKLTNYAITLMREEKNNTGNAEVWLRQDTDRRAKLFISVWAPTKKIP